MASAVSQRHFRIELPAPNQALLASTAMVLLIAVADFLTGYELTLSVLYLVPLGVTAWRCGLQPAIALSVLAVAAWMVSDFFSGHPYSHAFYRWWEALAKLGTWAAFVVLLDRLRDALDRSDERFVTVLESLDAIVYVADLDTAALLYTNPSCRPLVGGARDNAACIEAHWQPAPAGVLAAERLLDRHGEPHAGVTVEFHDAARARWYLVHARAIRWVGGRLVRLQVATDMTERREAKLRARRCQSERERAARLVMLGEMASTLAHELNQPLAAIANYHRGALRRLRSGSWDPQEIVAALEKAASQAERAGRIIHRVRDLTRKRASHRAACRVEAMIAHVATLLEPDLARARVRFEISIASTMPPVHADAVLIEQTLLNLGHNAIESMRSTPREHRLLCIAATPDTTGGRVRVEVADAGCGVPAAVAEDRHELFDTTREEGTGIGLHLCRSVLAAHESRLSVAPRPGGGSVFSFSLPAAAA